MMMLTSDGAPRVVETFCRDERAGQPMTQYEQREFLAAEFMRGLRGDGKSVKYCHTLKQKLFGIRPQWYYPDIECEDERGARTYYIVMPGDTDHGEIDTTKLPYKMRSGCVKLVRGTVYCMEKQMTDHYVHNCHYVVTFTQQTILPHQENGQLPEWRSDERLAEKFADACSSLSVDSLFGYIDKNVRYSSDDRFDEISSREEFIRFLKNEFKNMMYDIPFRETQLVRIGEGGALCRADKVG